MKLDPPDDLVRFWRSEVIDQGHSRLNCVVMKVSASVLGRQSSSSSKDKVHISHYVGVCEIGEV